MCFVPIPVADEPEHGGYDASSAIEAAVPQDSSLEDGKPYLDLVEPRRVQRRVHELEAVVVPFVEQAPSVFRAFLVNVEVVPDDDDPLSCVMVRHSIHEVQERVCVATLDDVTEYLPGADIERPDQCTCAVALVLEFVAHGGIGCAMRRILSRQDLHGLFIDAEDHGVFRRLEVKLADAADFRREFRVRAVEPRPDAMRAKAFGAEHALHRGAADHDSGAREKLVRECLLRPYRSDGRCIVRRTVACQRDDFATRLNRDLRRSPRSWSIEELFEARPFAPPRAPLAYRADIYVELAGHSRRPDALREQQNHPRASGQRLRRIAPTNAFEKPVSLVRRNLERRATAPHGLPTTNPKKPKPRPMTPSHTFPTGYMSPERDRPPGRQSSGKSRGYRNHYELLGCCTRLASLRSQCFDRMDA